MFGCSKTKNLTTKPKSALEQGPRLKSVIGPLWIADLKDQTGFRTAGKLERRFFAVNSRERYGSRNSYPCAVSKLERGLRLPDPERLNSLAYSYESLLRLFSSPLLRALSTRAPRRDTLWFERVRKTVIRRSLYKDPSRRASRALTPEGSNWTLRYCARKGDSEALAILLHLLNDIRAEEKPDITWLREVFTCTVSVSIRLMAFRPFHKVRHALWAYLAAYFLSGWDAFDPTLTVASIQLDAEISKIWDVVLTLRRCGYVGNDFEGQARMVYWFTKSDQSLILAGLTELKAKALSEITVDSPLYSFLKHARCWRTRDKNALKSRYERKRSEPIRMANALDAIYRPYEEDQVGIREMPTEKDINFMVKMREIRRDLKKNPPPPTPKHEFKRFRALEEMLTGNADADSRPPRPRRPEESHFAYAMSQLLGDPPPQSEAGSSLRKKLNRNGSLYHDPAEQIVIPEPTPTARAPPGIQHEHGVQR